MLRPLAIFALLASALSALAEEKPASQLERVAYGVGRGIVIPDEGVIAWAYDPREAMIRIDRKTKEKTPLFEIGQPNRALRVRDQLFVATKDTVWRAPAKGGLPTPLITGLGGKGDYGFELVINALATDGQHLFVATSNRLIRYGLDGKNPLVLDDGGGVPRIGDVAADSSAVYWIADGTLQRVPVEGGAVAPLFPEGKDLRLLTLDATRVFVADGKGAVSRIDKASGEVKKLAQFDAVSALAVDSARLYVADEKRKALYAVDPATGESVLFAAGANDPRELALDDRFVWLYEAGSDGGIFRAPKAVPGKVLREVPGIRLGCPEGLLSACLPACDKGDGFACYQLAIPFLDGNGGFARDEARGIPLLDRSCAAAKPYARGCALLGMLLQYGFGSVKADPAKSKEAREKACRLGDSRSCGN